MQRQMQIGFGIGAKSLRRAVTGEIDPPAEHVGDGTVAQEERGILLAQPLDDFRWHAGLGPGFDLAGMDDTAIPPARFHAGFRLALDKDDVVACFFQVPGARRADNACAQNNRGHRLTLPLFRPALLFAAGPSAGRCPPVAFGLATHIDSRSRSIRPATSRAIWRRISSESRFDSL